MKTIVAILILGLQTGAAAAIKTPEEICREFLVHLPDAHYASTGTQIVFEGEFTAVPATLQSDLARDFPDFSFKIAKMAFIHWGPEPLHLLVVVDKRTNRVCTFLWDLWFTDAPFSFLSTFSRELRSQNSTKERFATLASLIAFQMGWSHGELKISDAVLIAPLIATHNNRSRALQLKLAPEPTEMAFEIVPFQQDVPKPE